MRLNLKAMLLGAAALLATAIAGPLPASAAGDPTTLVVGKAGDVDTMDPAVTQTNNSWTVTYPAYERLVKFKVETGKGSTEVEGDVAKSWTVSDDGLQWTFTLADGHKFADGSPVDAAAIKYSFDRLFKVAKGPSETVGPVAEVQAIDAHTVKFILKEPFGPFLAGLATNGASIVSPAAAQHEKDGDLAQAYLAEHTLGSGPYQVMSWEKDQQIVMEPNPHYSGKAPFFKKVVIKIIKESAARRLQLEKGDIDMAEDLPIDQIDALKKVDGVTVVDEPSFQVTYLYLNNTRKPLDDVRVRQAISYAVDYKGIIDGILLGNGIQMRGPVPEGLWGHDDASFQFTTDAAKAKQLLADAGVKDLKLGYLYSKKDPNWESIGLVLQQNLAAIGITVELQEFAYPTMREKLNSGDFDIAAGNWTPDYGDPYMFMNYWFDSKLHGLPGNRAFYTNPKVDELIRKAATAADIAERKKLYAEAQKIVIEEAPYVLLFQANYQVAMRSDVKGFVYNPMTLQMFNFETMSRAQ
jgi:peptide/nickel transport system substrate-binding protein